MKITDNGPEPNVFDLETATKENPNYRTVAWTGKYLQVTLMSIPVAHSIGLEVHEAPRVSRESTDTLAARNVVTVEPDAGADAVAKLMSENQVRRLPVVENGSVIGVIAQADVARELSEDKTGEVVGDISKS